MSIRLLNLKDIGEQDSPGEKAKYSPLHNNDDNISRHGDDDEQQSDETSLTSDYLAGDFGLHEPAREGSYARVKSFLSFLQDQCKNEAEFVQARDKKNAQGYSALHLAARYNRVKVVQLLIDNRAPINDIDFDDKNTPLLLAAKYNMSDVANLLLDLNADATLSNKYGTTALHFACRRGNLQLCERLIDTGVEINATDNQGTSATPLHLAMLSTGIQDSTEVVKLLINKGADVNAPDSEGERPIHYAAAEDAGDFITLLAKGALKDFPPDQREKEQLKFLNVTSTEKDTALHVAAQAGYEETVKTLVSIGASVNARTDTNQTPLHLAAVGGQTKVVRYLVMNNAKINALDDDQMTPLHRACLFGRIETVNFLRERGAKLDATDKDSFTPLMCGVWKGQNNVVEFLLDNGANIKLKDMSSKNVLHLAIEDNHYETLDLLIKKGGDKLKELIDGVDKDYKTPLHYAAIYGNEEAITLLLNNGCKVDIGDNEEKTPLHCAAQFGHIESILILAKAASGIINATDERGRSPLHLAAMNGHIYVALNLIEKGAETSCRDDVNWTPLDYAAKNGHVKTMRVLLDNDAPVDAYDANKTTPLHHAAMKGHVNCVNLLLDNNASIHLRDKFGKNCLDVAIDNMQEEACMAIVTHKRWLETFREFNRGPGHFHPLEKLVKNAPDVAEVVLNHCIEFSHHEKKHEDYTIKCNFELLDPHPNEQMSNLYFAPSVMTKYKRDNLLSHPLTVICINHKWAGLGRWIYLFSLMLYLLFVSLLTALVVLEKDDQKKRLANLKPGDILDACATTDGSFSSIVPWLTIGLAGLQILKEAVQLIYYGRKYLKDVENIFEFCLYLSTFLFVLPFIMCQLGTSTTNQTIIELKWTAGAISILFAWFNLLLYLKRFPYFGLYVVMFVEVFRTLINVLIVFSILIIAFALSFYSLLNVQPAFRMPGRSIVRATVMMIGELEYGSTFNDYFVTDRHMLPYKEMSIFVFVLFIILMTIVVMNLLVGLAVGDIESVRKNAYLRILKAQVHIIRVLETSYPKWILKRVYRATVVIKPNKKNIFSKAFMWLGKFDYESLKNEQLEMGGKEDLIVEEVFVQKEEIKKQKDRMKTVLSLLEEQSAMMAKIAQKLNVSEKTREV